MATTPEAEDNYQAIQSPSVIDSAYASPRRENSLMTVDSEALQYSVEYGRRYAGYGQKEYLFPNDELEQDRLDLFHFLSQHVLYSRRICAPMIVEQARFLDLSAGTGALAIEIGDTYQSCLVVGVDVSMIQSSWIPPNVEFQLFDIEDRWTWQYKHHFIFGRQLGSSIQDWGQLVRQCYDNLEPGGWVEFHELDLMHYTQDDSINDGNKVIELFEVVSRALAILGRKLDVGNYLEELLREQGFQNIVHHVIPLPLGMWPKDKRMKTIGDLRLMEFLWGLEGLTFKPLAQGLGWTFEEIQVFLAEIRRDVRRRDVHLVSNFHVIYGQKGATAS